VLLSSTDTVKKPAGIQNTPESAPMTDALRELVAEKGGAGEPEAWRACWEAGLTGWDLGGPTPVLAAEATAEAVPAGARCLIPGCGGGYDVAALAQGGGGGREVVGLDVSEVACDRARAQCAASSAEGGGAGAGAGGGSTSIVCGDFFSADLGGAGSFDFAFDYTFFCALAPSQRAAWGRRHAELLKPGTGRLLTLAFPIGPDERAADPAVAGPPHTVSVAEYRKALEPHGLRLVGEPRKSEASVGARAPNELVLWWAFPAAAGVDGGAQPPL